MFWERFYYLCEIHKKKPTPVGREIGVSSGIISTWKKEGYCPSGEMLIKIADYFNCSIDYLVGRSDHIEVQKFDFSNNEMQIIEKLHALPIDGQEEIIHMINYKYDKLKDKETEKSSPFTKQRNDLLA